MDQTDSSKDTEGKPEALGQFLLFVAWLAFFLTTVLPLSLLATIGTWIGTWLLVTEKILISGGFALSSAKLLSLLRLHWRRR